jgi:hypothetical protein
MKTRPANPSHSARRSKNRRRFGRGLRRRKPGGGAAKSPNRTVVRMKSKLLVWRRGTLAHSKGSTKASAQKLNSQRKNKSAARVPWNGYTRNRSPRRRRTLARKENPLTAAWFREEDESTRRKSTAAAHHKPRTKTERKTAHNFGKRTQTKPTAREGNPSACFVEPENGPGRIDVEAKYKPRDGSFSVERRKEIPHELESTSKITRK